MVGVEQLVENARCRPSSMTGNGSWIVCGSRRDDLVAAAINRKKVPLLAFHLLGPS
jgi:hypothetical protein